MNSDVIYSEHFVRREGFNRQRIEIRIVKVSAREYEVATYTNESGDFPDEFSPQTSETDARHFAGGVVMGLRTCGFESE